MRTLNLLVLRCRDFEISRKFYEAFGMTFIKHAHGGGPQHYAHEDERGVFELYPAVRIETPVDETGLGFLANDLESCRLSLIERGFAPASIRENPWGRTFIVRDPDNRRVEVKAM